MRNVSDSAWLYLMMVGESTVGEVRRLNRDTAMPWTIGLLMALLDAGVSTDAENSDILRAQISVAKDTVSDVINCYRGDQLVASVAECDEDGVFVVLCKSIVEIKE